ncbi:MAG: hypothetical protein LCH67_09805 [Bacteroidetes bacterium]|nr:hypothetical protein [Bacteroidota bacterium]
MEDLINKYFEKSLTEKELADFYQKLETEPEFKAEFEFQKSVQTAYAQMKEPNSRVLYRVLRSRNKKAFGGNMPQRR